MPNKNLHDFFSRYVAVLNTHAFHQLSEFMHEDLIVNGQPTTRDRMISELEDHVEAVPDLAWRVADLAVEGEKIAARFWNFGTPIKEWLGAMPNGAAVQYAEHVFHKVVDGRFNEQNFLLDTASIRQQLATGTHVDLSPPTHADG